MTLCLIPSARLKKNGESVKALLALTNIYGNGQIKIYSFLLFFIDEKKIYIYIYNA